MDFLSDDQGKKYNMCHCTLNRLPPYNLTLAVLDWSNFEISDMDFWRSEPYQKFFDFLEAKGGFYYERWGDAPVHSIAASYGTFSAVQYQADAPVACLPAKTRFISSVYVLCFGICGYGYSFLFRTLATATKISNIVPLEISGVRAAAHVIQGIPLVRYVTLLSAPPM